MLTPTSNRSPGISSKKARPAWRLKRRIRLTRGALDHRLRTLPILVLYPHSRCDCRCVMCDIWKANGSLHEWSAAELAPVRDELILYGVKDVILSGGEPLMHQELFGICDLLRGGGIDLTLVTAGLLLERYAVEVADNCSKIIVSLDGPEEIHDGIRNRRGAFSKLSRGIGALKRIRPSIHLTGRCTVQRRNFSFLSETVRAAQRIGLDQISFLAADMTSTAFNRPNGWPAERALEVVLSPADVSRFREVIEQLISSRNTDHLDHFVKESPAQLWRLHDYFAALNGQGPLPPVRCQAPWISAVLDAEGNVFPCFFHKSYGNLRDGTLKEVLNAPKSIAFRRNLDVKTNPICRRCVCSIQQGGILDRLSRGRVL